MAFKMRSQSAVKKGGYKAMGSSALKTVGHGLKPDYPDHPHSHHHSYKSGVEWKKHAKAEEEEAARVEEWAKKNMRDYKPKK